jgi:hypothetical protein
MDKHKAAEMIERERRRWRSQDSDSIVARRAELYYLVLALADVCIAITLMLTLRTQLTRVAIPVCFVVIALLIFIHSRRFSQARRLLANSDAKSDSH